MAAKRKIRFGIIGCGLMGREFAVASARWPALVDMQASPEIIGICDLNENLFEWYKSNFDSIRTYTTNYEDLLSDKDSEIIYCVMNLRAAVAAKFLWWLAQYMRIYKCWGQR